MGDVGTKRSALVSRLPIFRRTLSRRQDSLPSSPSSNNTGGLHSSSPSSTNSSSGSTGKRRSIFRTPSLSFQHKKESSQRYECSQGRNSVADQNELKNLNLEEQSKIKLKGSTCIPGSSRKKITRSFTENFEGKKEHSSHKNVFTNCLGKGEDDSGFIEDQTRHSLKHSSRKLLPRSFSSHYRFSKHGSQCTTPSPSQTSGCKEEVHTHTEINSLLNKAVQQSTNEVTDFVEHSLQSPLISTDHTTAPQTPSDFTFMDDSASEADSLPNSTNQHSSKQHCHLVSTSQNVASPLSITSNEENNKNVAEDNSQCDSLAFTKPKVKAVVERSESNPSPVYSKPLLPICELPSNNAYNLKNGTEEQRIDKPVYQNGEHSYSTQTFPKRSEPAVYHKRHAMSTMPNHHSLQETNGIASLETQSAIIHHGHTRVNYASSFSPHRDGRYSERRLRSSSEGTAGGSRMAFKPKEGHPDELSHFRKQRTISTSSKMNSMDVLNNLGSCELDEDDLMLDLEFTEEQQLRRVCREDSYQSIVSCSAVVLSHMEQASETNRLEEEPKMTEPTKRNLFLHLPKDSDPDDTKCPRVCQVPSSPSVEWPFTQEDCTGLESLPFRLMMQDCTSVKTLLLKMKRLLQESSELSPASSTTSLPISPMADRGLSFKDIMKDDCSVLKLQLKERDELIHQLQEELKATRTLQPLNVLKQEKCTQTEVLNHDVTNNRMPSQQKATNHRCNAPLVQRNAASTESSVYKAIRPVHCFQHYQFKTNIWTQDALH
ncbi:serine-rich coiled-coil domain-containing protein 1 isoform X3 [Dendrobates tinctorius]|uniref:serine-rich coiled-coil domain-containing protein 1 isoform X3 n=1 Tax=Dendrobates tinctorius TaxID=92724 RepID=UPI003CCA0CF5